jgi:hypothetical protein
MSKGGALKDEKQKPARLVEGEDYYLEGGLMVFTALYHLKRGYCCESGCRHCPYKDAPDTRRA